MTLCSPVPGCVYKSTWTETSPTLPSCDAEDAAHVGISKQSFVFFGKKAPTDN